MEKMGIPLKTSSNFRHFSHTATSNKNEKQNFLWRTPFRSPVRFPVRSQL